MSEKFLALIASFKSGEGVVRPIGELLLPAWREIQTVAQADRMLRNWVASIHKYEGKTICEAWSIVKSNAAFAPSYWDFPKAAATATAEAVREIEGREYP